MEITPRRLNGTYQIVLAPHGDERGYFMRVWDEQLSRQHGLTTAWVQENQSLSRRKGIIRGLHFQRPPHAETKLVRVAAGAILDVFVDLRKGSHTYGQWDSLELSAENHRVVYIPRGFAHGFCTLTDEALVVYKVDAYYAPESEGGLRWDDEVLRINWPTRDPLVSDKDKRLPSFKEFVSPFE
ncbi:MAG: dTDP-4-dehydrorhamnose 3,5-epimerase [Terriglobia bacterium]|jgi:dTDP-4-dehydrorhamnose 3,5-epimerase